MAVLLVVLLVPSIRWQFLEIGIRWLYILLLSFMIAYLLTPLVRSIAWNRGVLDQPNERKVHDRSIPLWGGIAVYLGVLGAIGANAILSEGMVPILLA